MPLETIVVNDENLFDIFVIGAGPSGLTAALYGARSGLKTSFIDRSTPGGKVASLKNVSNYPGYESISGSELATIFYKQAVNAGAKYIYGNVSNVLKKLGYWAIYGEDGNTWFTKALIIATGMENKKLNISGEKDYQGIGISYCVTCDGNLAKNKVATIYGNVEETFSSAIYLSTIASKVNLVTSKTSIDEKFANAIANNKNINVITDAIPYEIEGDAFNVSDLVIKKDNEISKIKSDFIFVIDGYVPATNFVSDLGIIENNIIKVNENKATNLEGIYAIGDVSKLDNHQIITATNDGAIAGMNAVKYVKEAFKVNDTK